MGKTILQLMASTIAKQHNISTAKATTFVEQFFALIKEELKGGNSVKIKGLGTFKIQGVKPRESVNVNTGERVLIEGHDKITFTPDSSMKELVNKPFSQFETVVINEGVDIKKIESTSDTNSHEVVADEGVNEMPNQIAKDSPKEVEGIEVNKELSSTPLTNENKTEELEPKEEKVETKEEVSWEGTLPENESAEPTTKDAEATPKEEQTKTQQTREFVSLSTKHSSMEISITENEHDEEGTTNGLLKITALITVVVIACLGTFLWIRLNGAKVENNKLSSTEIVTQPQVSALTPPKAPVKKVSKTEKKDSSVVKKNEHVSEESKIINNNEINYAELNNDKRIRYGAYNIVGIDKIVVLRKGETMKSYSKRHLGEEMIVYFQALNGRETMSEGDSMKVPKVELRPQYRKR